MKKLLVGAAVFVAAVAIVMTFHAPPDAQALANPASVYCAQLGGTEQTVTASDGSQDGFCHLPNGTVCNSWDLYRGNCPGYIPASSGTLYDTNGRLLKEGDLISANAFGDPDIFIIHFKPHGNLVGYKRLFLNPAIFSFYGHLGGYANVHPVTIATRDLFETSGLFRNCETNDQAVWATEVTGEDSGVLHHVQMTGDQAVAENARFFDAVFCINTHEENYYAKSITPYYHLSEVPPYFRSACQVRPACLDAIPRCMIPEPASGWCPSPSPTPIACAMTGEYAVNYTVSPAYQVRQCCPGLVQIDYPSTGMMGAPSKMCAPSGCYYQQVQCITAPCNPILVCPTPSPTATPVTSVYTNNELGFTLFIPSSWYGYDVSVGDGTTSGGTPTGHVVSFFIPETVNGDMGLYNVFNVGVSTIAQFALLPNPQTIHVITQTATTVYYWYPSNSALPSTSRLNAALADVPSVVASFRPLSGALTCNQVCSTDADCAIGLSCYQPPFYCPSGQYCAQVMPAKICRNQFNPTNTSCLQ